MEKFFLNLWYTNSFYYRCLAYIFLPLTLVYLFVFYFLNFFKNEIKFNIPIICIGNINIGGTGKTATTISLVREFQEKGKKICVLLRGYGGANIKFKKVLSTDSVNETGDEALLYAKHVTTFISNNRAYALKKIIRENDLDYIFLDDGFQDKSVSKNKIILTINGKKGLGNELCLPSGPLRELIIPALKRANFMIIVGDDYHKIKQKYKKTGIEFFSAYIVPYNNRISSSEYLAFCGIGNNQSFFDTLKENNFKLKKYCEFPDHYRYSKNDINLLLEQAKKNNLSLITTEKDIVRVPKDQRDMIEHFNIRVKINHLDDLVAKLIN